MAHRSSSSTEKLGGDIHYVPKNQAPLKWKTCGCAIAIIFGVIGVGAGLTGVCGFFHVGALSNMAQVDAIIMMAVGGGGGIILLIIGIIGTVKNRQRANQAQQDDKNVELDNSDQSDSTEGENTKKGGANVKSHSTKGTENVPPIDTDGLVYGKEAYKKAWNIEIADEVPEAPPVDWEEEDPYFKRPYKENYVLVYFAEKVRVDGQERDFDLPIIHEKYGKFAFFNTTIKEQFGKSPSGWKLVSKTVIPDSRNKNYETQENMVKAPFLLLHAREAIILNQIVFALTNERLYGQEPWTYSRCLTANGIYPVVGGFGSGGLSVIISCLFGHDFCGVGVLREF